MAAYQYFNSRPGKVRHHKPVQTGSLEHQHSMHFSLKKWLLWATGLLLHLAANGGDPSLADRAVMVRVLETIHTEGNKAQGQTTAGQK